LIPACCSARLVSKVWFMVPKRSPGKPRGFRSPAGRLNP
jgi:hypothetical protein